MLPLSAADAIAPAITRSHALLLGPFRWGRSWKLAAVSALALYGSVFIPFPLFLASLPPSAFSEPGSARGLAFAVVGVFFLVYLAVVYVGVRLEMVAFQMTAAMETKIALMWRRYGRRVLPWIAVKVVTGTLVTALAARPILAELRSFAALMPPPGTPPDPMQFTRSMPLIFGFYAIVFGYFGLLKLVDTVLHDFVLPVYLLEPVPLGMAFRKGFAVLAADAGQSILYLALKTILGIAGYFLLQIVSVLSFIPIGLVGFVGIFGGALVLSPVHGPAGMVLKGVGAVLVWLLCMAGLFYTQIGVFGYMMNLFESYGVWFVGSRYKPLGDLLTADSTVPYTPPPPTLPPADPGEPPFPMDPAIA